MTVLAPAQTIATDCYHCGLPVPVGLELFIEINGEKRSMCCPGCQAVASSIVDGGLENFYRFRSERAQRPKDNLAPQWDVYDLEDLQIDFVNEAEDGTKEAQLLVGGISCAACVWLIEKQLARLPGVESVRVNASTHRCLVRWSPEQQSLSRLMAEIHGIGYDPRPATDEQAFQVRKQESRTALLRLGVAGIGMMQVGMVAVALYAGGLQGIGESMQNLLRLLSLLIATPVVLFSARPFFQAAWRSLGQGRLQYLTMDVPVALAIGGAYVASVYATLANTGEVYFDSVSMFTFFLLLGRYLEMRVRHGNSLASGNLSQLLPLSVNRKSGDDDEWETVPLKVLHIGDRVMVRAGEIFPCDGVVLRGCSSVEEALLTGEAAPLKKVVGDHVIAGTLNTASAIEVEALALGDKTTLSTIEKLVAKAEMDKPRRLAQADRLAGYFVTAVLIFSALVGFYWYQVEPGQAFWVVLSVLVVTCPCALSLATPVVLVAATAAARQQGFLISQAHVLESLVQVSRSVFDKTGTLTMGRLQLDKWAPVSGNSGKQMVRDMGADNIPSDVSSHVQIAAELEKNSRHPIAFAFLAVQKTLNLEMENHQEFVSEGVEGVLAGQCYRLGSVDFVSGLYTNNSSNQFLPEPPSHGSGEGLQWLLLGNERGPLIWFGLSDSVRREAPSLLSYFKQSHIPVELLSGDASPAVADLANNLDIEAFTAGAKPEQKMQRVKVLQQEGETVLMIGDGINDVPVLAAADVSIAMGDSTDLAQMRADAVLLHNDLGAIEGVHRLAFKARNIIRQNITWALIYNATALPLAALGLVPPWAAAIGMSVSSLVVTGNAMRLKR